MQPFRNSALVMPGPKTIHEVRIEMMNAAVAGSYLSYLQQVVIVQFVREPSLSLVCVTITVTTLCNTRK